VKETSKGREEGDQVGLLRGLGKARLKVWARCTSDKRKERDDKKGEQTGKAGKNPKGVSKVGGREGMEASSV